jgi:3-hydroxy-9,10-secoandrosta-1,3,5(10)-triene-9,17-dione monooxygenase
VDGGFKLTGTWSFSSGCGHCQWAILGGIIVDEGIPNHYSFLVPRSDYVIDDVWHVVGLAGTGSNDVRLEHVFVPDHRAQPTMFDVEASGRGSGLSALYRLPFASVFANAITSSAIGIGAGAIDTFKTAMKSRIKVSSGVKASGDVHVQTRLAEAASEIDAAKLQLSRNMDEMLELAEQGMEIPMELRVRVRRDQVRGTQAAIRATDRVFESAGGRALYLDQPIQRFWRDVHAARVHAINEYERGLSLYGSHELGAGIPPGNMV